MTEIEETFEEILERLTEARKHWDTYKTDELDYIIKRLGNALAGVQQ